MQLDDEVLNLETVDSIQMTSSAIMTLIQQSQEKLERFFTMSKSYSQIEFFLVEWGDMTKTLKIDCIQLGCPLCFWGGEKYKSEYGHPIFSTLHNLPRQILKMEIKIF